MVVQFVPLDVRERLWRRGVGSVGVRLFTNKLVFDWSEVLSKCSHDSATPAIVVYLAHMRCLADTR